MQKTRLVVADAQAQVTVTVELPAAMLTLPAALSIVLSPVIPTAVMVLGMYIVPRPSTPNFDVVVMPLKVAKSHLVPLLADTLSRVARI